MAMLVIPRVLSTRVLGQALTQVQVDSRSESTVADIVAQQSSTTRSCLGLEKNTKLGVLFLNLGGPEKLQVLHRYSTSYTIAAIAVQNY